MAKHHFGIVGTGVISTTFCEALARLPGAEIYAVTSRTGGSGRAFADKFGIEINHIYTKIEDMCADPRLDVVYIGTPHSEHFAGARAAILAGKHVLCEKPMTISLPQAEELIRLVGERGVFLMEALCTGFLPAFRQVRAWIDAGEIGAVKAVEAGFHLPGELAECAGRILDPALGGGLLLDVGVYPIYCANTLFDGEPEIIFTRMEPAETGVDRAGWILLKYPDGTAYLSFGLGYYNNRGCIIGEDGFIEFPELSASHAAYLFKGGEVAASFHQPLDNHLFYEAEHLLWCLDNHLTESPEYPLEMTRRSMRLCDRVREQWGLHYPCEGLPEPTIRETPAIVPVALNNQVMDWYRDAVFYHIYPLGMCGAPAENDDASQPVNRLGEIEKLIPHLQNIGANALYIGPLFESSCHGYDTKDFRAVDRRLGTNEDFAGLCAKLHGAGIRVILDGVFNHVGRDFFAFADLRRNRQASPYRDWFYVDFGRDSADHDGFWYEGWEGHFTLVKLNLSNPEVKRHIFDSIKLWRDRFGIDGLRLDVAYSLDEGFLRELCAFCKGLSPDFFLLGEMVHGDYNRIMNDNMLDSVTNYVCWKGLYSAIVSSNMHEIAYSIHQQYGGADWCQYRGRNLYTFLENHDVSRIATILKNPAQLPLAYALMFAMPGIPSVYYGGELAMEGDKSHGDAALRPALTAAELSKPSALSEMIGRLARIRRSSAALCRGRYAQLHVGASAIAFERAANGERVIFAVNIGESEVKMGSVAGAGKGTDLITGREIDLSAGLAVPPGTAYIIKTEQIS